MATSKRQLKAKRFEELMSEINSNYSIGKKLYVDTIEGKVLGSVSEINPSKFLVSCSIVIDLGNGTFLTEMFTN